MCILHWLWASLCKAALCFVQAHHALLPLCCLSASTWLIRGMRPEDHCCMQLHAGCLVLGCQVSGVLSAWEQMESLSNGHAW